MIDMKEFLEKSLRQNVRMTENKEIYKENRKWNYILWEWSRKNIEKWKYIEKRQSTDLIFEDISKTNKYNLEQCISRKYNYILIDKDYLIDTDDI